MTTSVDLVNLSVAALKAAGTAAGDRVYSPGDWPTWDGLYPYLRVTCPDEDKQSLGPATIEFKVVATIRFLARIEAAAAVDDGGAAQAEAALGAFKQQIERTVINHPTIMPLLEHYPFVRSRQGFTSDGEQHFADQQVDIGMQFYQGPEDFYQPVLVTLEELNIATQLPDPASPVGVLDGPIIDLQLPVGAFDFFELEQSQVLPGA
jgi:hypothetical protein